MYRSDCLVLNETEAGLGTVLVYKNSKKSDLKSENSD